MAHGRTVTPSRPIWQNHYNIIHIILYWHPYFFREHQKLHWKKHKSSCCAYKVRIRHQLINKCNRRNKFCRSNIKTIALMIIMGTTTTTTTMVMATTTATTTWSKWLPQVCSSPDLGRYLVATRDLKPGELVISETPLIIGPQVRHFKHSHHYNFVFQCLS